MKSSSRRRRAAASSMSSATGPSTAIRSKKMRQPANSSSRDSTSARRRHEPSSRASAGATYSRSAGSGTSGSSPSRELRRATSARVLLGDAEPARTISASAQKATPSPYDRQRPRCQNTCSIRPSTYFSNSQPSRRLADAAGPLTDHQPRRAGRAPRWNRSLTSRSSASRPIIGASSPSTRWTPPTPAMTRTRPPQVLRLGLALELVFAGVLELEGRCGEPPGRSSTRRAGGCRRPAPRCSPRRPRPCPRPRRPA